MTGISGRRTAPYFAQQADYDCGAACLRMVFARLGLRLSAKAARTLLDSRPRFGTSHRAIVTACRRAGLRVVSGNSGSPRDLRQRLARGESVIVNYSIVVDGDSFGHFAVPVRSEGDYFFLHDPWFGPDYPIAGRKLAARWHGDDRRRNRRWFVSVSPQVPKPKKP